MTNLDDKSKRRDIKMLNIYAYKLFTDRCENVIELMQKNKTRFIVAFFKGKQDFRLEAVLFLWTKKSQRSSINLDII